MSHRKIPNRQALIDALREHDGNMAAVSRKFGCHRTLVWQYVDSDPELRELVEELSESFCDEAESQLFKLIREGNTAAVIFFCKTRLASRGYSEHLRVTGVNLQNILIELGQPSNASDENDHTPALDGDSSSARLLEQ